jgi:hypothetical protein
MNRKDRRNQYDDLTGRIDITNLEEVKYWTSRFKISRPQLIKAIKEVGPQVAKVIDYFTRK